MPFEIPWDQLESTEIFVMVILLVAMFLAAGILRIYARKSGQENATTHQLMRDTIQRQSQQASEQFAVSKRTDMSLNANIKLWQEGCNILRHVAPEMLPNDKLIQDVQRRVDEMERIIREAG